MSKTSDASLTFACSSSLWLQVILGGDLKI